MIPRASAGPQPASIPFRIDMRTARVVGGMIALLAAIDRPERIGRLAMIGSSPRYLDEVIAAIEGFVRT